jgi:lipopolysaccharide biosynthesis glycosyltransferase/glycosyltransferase involved in cell wall biosynthesis
VPTRDRPALLREALASIRALEGSDLRFEILVGDNGTDPDTAAAAAEYGAVHMATRTNGAAAARNLGLMAASGEFIAFLDDDDLWQKDHIREHLAMMDADPGLDAVVGQVTLTDTHRRPLGDPSPDSLPADGEVFMPMMSGWFPQIGGTVIRRSLRDVIGPFDETLIGDQDWDFQLRIARRTRIGFVAKPCVLFRDRPPGSYDKLQLRRIPFTRKVFLRHAWAERNRWPSVQAWLRSYFACFQYFYYYFADAVEERANLGRPLRAWRAAAIAFGLFPTRAARNLLQDTPIRRGLMRTLNLDAKRRREEGAKAERIDIAMGIDRNYAPHAAAVIASLVQAAPGQRYRFIILHTDVEPELQTRVEGCAPGCDFLWTVVGENDLPKWANRAHFTRATLFRLGLEKLGPADCRRVLYLDADIAVANDVRPLWNTDLEGNVLGAVTDENVNAGLFAARWRLPGGCPSYFNAGILLIDLEKVRSEGLFQKAADFIAEHDRELPWNDQDALNWAIWGRWKLLAPVWNVQRLTSIAIARGEASLPAGRSPSIVHYTGSDKPWVPGSYHPWSHLYWRALSRTPFFDEVVRKNDVSRLERMRVWLRGMRRWDPPMTPKPL